MAYNILIFVPAFAQQMTAATVMSLQSTQMAFAQKGISSGFSTLSFPDIAELRSMVSTMFWESPDMKAFTHLMMADADMGWAPQLPLDMLALDEPLVGSIYAQRRIPTSWAGSGTGEAVAERKGDFMRVEGVGMGCTLIRREVFDKIAANEAAEREAVIDRAIGDDANSFRDAGVYTEVRASVGRTLPPFFDPRIAMHPGKDMLVGAKCTRLVRFFDPLDVPERGRISEDLSFCIRAGRAGIPTWAAIGHRLAHVGPHDFGARYLDAIEQGDKGLGA